MQYSIRQKSLQNNYVNTKKKTAQPTEPKYNVIFHTTVAKHFLARLDQLNALNDTIISYHGLCLKIVPLNDLAYSFS